MKKKIIAVLLCVALLLTLSVNASANGLDSTPDLVVQTADSEAAAELISQDENISVASATSGIVSGAVYRIKNVGSGKYMNVHYGVDANGTNIYQWTADGSTEQKFRVVYFANSDSYLIYAMCSSNGNNRVVDVTRGSSPLTHGQNIKLYNPTDPTSQQLKIISTGQNQYRIAMKNNTTLGLAACGTSNGSASGTSATSAGNIFISTYTGATNQQWQFELLQNPPNPEGSLDSVTASTIGGWAYQTGEPDTPIWVHFYITNNSTNQQTFLSELASNYRSDLEAAGYGDGEHAFHHAMNWYDYPAGTYTVRAYAIGSQGINPEISNSPKTFTVRNMTGVVDHLNSSGISGWAWKPDAPNNTVAVNVYVRNSDNETVGFYNTRASNYRSDLENAGYGDGEHGFSISIDWSTLPEENLRVTAYAVDGTGIHPAFYDGYYDNRMPIYLIGMTDEQGVDFSTWATQEVVNYAYNIGTPSVMICSGANKEGLLNVIRNSSFAVVYSHGTATSIDYCFNPNTASEGRGKLLWRDFLTMPSNYFINTRCLLLNACSVGNETENPAGNNMVKVFQSKGVQTVVGYEYDAWFWYFEDGSISTDLGTGRWAKAFVRKLSEGATVQTAVNAAINDAILSFENEDEPDDDKRYEEAYDIAKGYGLVDVCIAGNANQVIKH